MCPEEPTDAHSASKQRRPSLSPFEARILKCAEDATTSLTDLSASWRSTDSALLKGYLADLVDSLGGMAEQVQQMAISLEGLERMANRTELRVLNL